MPRSPRPFWPFLLSAIVLAVSLGALLASDAAARTAFQSLYTLDQNFSAALRLVRVDMGLRVTEKDPEAAYILFEYKSSESGSRVSSGSIEMVPQSSAVQVVVQLPQMPQYHEEVMANSLKKKLQQDYGDPPRQQPVHRRRADAGADAEAGSDEAR